MLINNTYSELGSGGSSGTFYLSVIKQGKMHITLVRSLAAESPAQLIGGVVVGGGGAAGGNGQVLALAVLHGVGVQARGAASRSGWFSLMTGTTPMLEMASLMFVVILLTRRNRRKTLRQWAAPRR